MALHHGGAGRDPTTALLIGTLGIGIDAVAVTYALLKAGGLNAYCEGSEV